MDGKGKFTWADGDTFVGSWKANKRQGEGTLKPKEGEAVVKMYSMGQETGK
jgi:hypothetical protein